MPGPVTILRSWLAHPLMRGRDLDDPQTTTLRRDIVRAKPFLRQIYNEWYATLAADLPPISGRVLELGSGAGYFREAVPDVICSEVFSCPGIDLVLDGQRDHQDSLHVLEDDLGDLGRVGHGRLLIGPGVCGKR